MSDYKAGDNAFVTALNRTQPYRAYFDGKTWREYDSQVFCVDTPASIRPLVVLDLDPALDHMGGGMSDLPEVLKDMRRGGGIFADRIADQIEDQIKPPRIDEPGLWGVVAADGQGLDDVHWVRTKASPPWLAVEHGRYAEWQQLLDPILIREGLS